MFKALRIRLTILCTSLTGLILICMAFSSLKITERQLTERANEAFSASLHSIFFYLRGQIAIDHTWPAQTEASVGLMIHVDDGIRPLQYSQNKPEREKLFALAKKEALDQFGFNCSLPPSTRIQPDQIIFPMEADGIVYRVAATTIPVAKGWLGLVVLKSTVQEEHRILKLRLSFFGPVLGAIGCLFLFSWFFTAHTIRPVEENRRRQVDFVSAASHELRSPLAVIRASADAIKSAPPEQAKHFLKAIVDESVRLTRLTDDLLTLAGADNHHLTIQKTLV